MNKHDRYTIIAKNPFLPGLLIIAFLLIIYLPSLNIYLMRDDFEWLNESYSAWQNPSTLLQTINSFFRPMVKLSYILDYTFFKTSIPFYNLTTILFHLVNVSLLYIFLYRVTKKIHIAALCSLAYGSSPFYSEVTLWAAGRPESILLMFMMGVMLSYTNVNEKEKISLRRPIGIIIMTLCAAGSKESWLTLPFLVLGFLLTVKQMPLKVALKKTFDIFLLLVFYIGYFIVLPLLSGTATPTLYNKFDIRIMIQKFGFLIFKYSGLGESFTGSAWQYGIIALVLGGLIYRFLRSKNWLALWGLIWMLLNIGISIFIFYAPSRYNYLPLVGFWIMVISFLSREIKILLEKFNLNRRLVFLGLGIIFLLHLSYQVAMLRLEISDYRDQGAPHKQLVDMYTAIKDQLPRHQPIIFVDISTRKAVDEAARSVKGYRKLLFVRAKAIWQLVFLPPLANFAGDPFKERMEFIPAEKLETIFQGEYTVLVFNDAAFFISDSYKPGLQAYFQKYRTLPNKVQAVQFSQNVR